MLQNKNKDMYLIQTVRKENSIRKLMEKVNVSEGKKFSADVASVKPSESTVGGLKIDEEYDVEPSWKMAE